MRFAYLTLGIAVTLFASMFFTLPSLDTMYTRDWVPVPCILLFWSLFNVTYMEWMKCPPKPSE